MLVLTQTNLHMRQALPGPKEYLEETRVHPSAQGPASPGGRRRPCAQTPGALCDEHDKLPPTLSHLGTSHCLYFYILFAIKSVSHRGYLQTSFEYPLWS